MDNQGKPPQEIRDPIHGAVPVDDVEIAIIDHPFIQRLRGIRQLGFSHLPFPGATHTRYNHSLGVMHLAGRAFDACFRDGCGSFGIGATTEHRSSERSWVSLSNNRRLRQRQVWHC